MLLNHLAVHENCDIIFDSFDALPDDRESDEQKEKQKWASCSIPTSLYKTLLGAEVFKFKSICPSFVEYQKSVLAGDDDDEENEDEANQDLQINEDLIEQGKIKKQLK